MKLYAPSTINEIKKKYGFSLSKSLGQNFLTDKNIIDKILEASCITREDLVIEIGPGIGVLTGGAAELAGKVIAIELDSRLIPILEETLGAYDNVEIIQGDILKINLKEVIEAHGLINGQAPRHIRIIGNLPYYITTPILMKLLEEGVPADSITVMMQKEVAQRLLANPGDRDCGAITLAVHYYCTAKKVASVSREVFMPPPNVDSTVIRLDIRKEKPIELIDDKMFFACVKSSFGQRRKTLGNSLLSIGTHNKEDLAGLLSQVGIDPSRRGETLSLEEFGRIANALSEGEEASG